MELPSVAQHKMERIMLGITQINDIIDVIKKR